jgi:hypothetical protein
VVTHEECKQKFWPSDTVVDFEHGLNRAINKIREALGDSAESPHFLETLPRRGINSSVQFTETAVRSRLRFRRCGTTRVLPFKYSSNGDLMTLAAEITDDVATGLTRFSYLRVISCNSTARYASEIVVTEHLLDGLCKAGLETADEPAEIQV